MDNEKQIFLNRLLDHKDEYESMLKVQPQNPKNANLSKIVRTEGNELFQSKNHDLIVHEKIFKLYCSSVILAPPNSEELAFAYGNRSAFLLHVEKFHESLTDIDRAMNLAHTMDLKIKLLCRKAKCLSALGSSDSKKTLEEAIQFANNIDDIKKRNLCTKFIEKTSEALKNVIKKSPILEDIKRSEKEVEDIFNSVDLQYSKQYGRHLVAKRDFLPGDIIFIDDIYVSNLKLKYAYTFCHYCARQCWTGIPCDTCIEVIFCSEGCKKKAMEQFHKIECPVISFYNEMVKNDVNYDRTYICLKLLIMGIVEAGNIEKFKADLKLIDECQDPCWKGLKIENEINVSFETIYSLNSSINPKLYEEEIYRSLCDTMCLYTILLSRNPLISENISLNKIDDLINEENVLFLGSLLIKLLNMRALNSYAINDVSKSECWLTNDNKSCKNNVCCIRGTCISTFFSFVNHSCVPNVNRCFTDKQMIIYAIHPIEKGAQLFISYGPDFNNAGRIERLNYLLRYYNFDCNCIACKSNWPENPSNYISKHQLEKYACESLTSIEDIKIFDSNLSFQHSHIKKISHLIAKDFDASQIPTSIMQWLISALDKGSASLYNGVKYLKFRDCNSR